MRREFKESLVGQIKDNPKSFWNYANFRLHTKTRVEDLRRLDGTLASADSEKVEILEKFFSSVFTPEDESEASGLQTAWNGAPLLAIEIVPEAVEEKLKKLKGGKPLTFYSFVVYSLHIT